MYTYIHIREQAVVSSTVHVLYPLAHPLIHLPTHSLTRTNLPTYLRVEGCEHLLRAVVLAEGRTRTQHVCSTLRRWE